MPAPIDPNLSPSASDFPVNLAAAVRICKWRDYASRCSVRDGQPSNTTQRWPRNPPRPLPAADVVDLTDDQRVVRVAQGPSRRGYQRPRADSDVQEMTMVDLTQDDNQPQPQHPLHLGWYQYEEDEA